MLKIEAVENFIDRITLKHISFISNFAKLYYYN